MVKRIGYATSLVILALLASPMAAMAAQGASSGKVGGLAAGLVALGAGLGIGIAALGCGIGQGRIAGSAMESIGRNPNSANSLFVPMIIGLAFVESLTLYALVISFFLNAKF